MNIGRELQVTEDREEEILFDSLRSTLKINYRIGKDQVEMT